MTYHLTQAAEEDVIRLVIEGAERFGLHKAETYHSELELCFEFLCEYPRAARERLDIEPPVRVHPFGSHVVIYRIHDSGIVIIGVRHARENWTQIDWQNFN